MVIIVANVGRQVTFVVSPSIEAFPVKTALNSRTLDNQPSTLPLAPLALLEMDYEIILNRVILKG